MAISVGSVSVDVVPDARGFRPKLEEQLRDLPSVKIKLDTAEAQARLAALRAELDQMRDKNVRVRVDNNFGALNAGADAASAGAIAKITLIGTAILALIPIAAAASVAIAGIGVGVGLGVLGALVGKLALGGVGAATKAAVPSGGGGSTAAADAERVASAVNGQRQAEVGLASAQRDSVQAQKDLTQARIDAAQALQDLSNQVTDNSLAQRQAQLDLDTATRNLAVAKASPDAQNPANAGALAQVQLAFDSAKQNLTELSQAGTKLAAQQVTANALGVDGASNVVQAQQKIVDTQDALVQAQFQVADSARQVALAHQASASGAAAYGAALAKLNPAQQKFAEFLVAIKPQLDQLKLAASNSFLPLLQQAIEGLLPILPQISTILGIVGAAFGQLAVQASAFFTSPEGQKFLTFVQQNIGPAIDTLGRILGGLFTTFLTVFQQAYPYIKQFGDAVAGALGGADKGVQGGALNGFFSYLKENLPQIKKTLGDVVGAVGSIFQSLAPLAGPALKAIGDIAKDIAALVKVAAPVVKVLLPFAPAILAAVVAFKAFAAVSGVVKTILPVINALLAANPWVLLALAVAAVVAGFIYAYTHFKTFRDIVNDVLDYGIKPLFEYFKFVTGVELKIFMATWDATWTAVQFVYSNIIEPVFDGIKTAVEAVPGIFKSVKDAITGAWSDIWGGLAGVVSSAFNGVTSVIVDVINGIITVIDGIIGGINDVIDGANYLPGVNVKHISPISHIGNPSAPAGPSGGRTGHNTYAAGGEVFGPGSGTSDSIPAWLSRGEIVMRSSVAQANRSDLLALNNGTKSKLGGSITQNNTFTGTNPGEVLNQVLRRLDFAKT